MSIVLQIMSCLSSIGELASSPTIGYDLHVVYMQIWLANIFCLAEIHIQTRYECVESLWLAVSPGVWVAVNASASHNALIAQNIQ